MAREFSLDSLPFGSSRRARGNEALAMAFALRGQLVHG
jgi:hypothetical protein